ncbi:chemokine XC receptor 1-like [Colossoma macropomum]|uniref:chemokine XC receptor 1-like n=1 Tax=Colossoma macropomum TaxID=42526 RepID=UPI001863D590|nr:chemokine XC receptor 1-like [Colossoma macropomum]
MDYTNEAEYESVYEYDIDNSTGFSFCLKETVAQVGSTAVPLLFSIVVLLSLVGNILVLVILGLYENLRSLTNIFILSLALSDLMFTLGLPFWSSQYIWGWTFGDAVCKGISFVFSAGYYSRIVFLMLMTIQCYVAVVHPLSDCERGQRVAAVPILAWVVSFGAAMPALLYSEVMGDPVDYNVFYCVFDSMAASVNATYQQNIFFVVAFLVVAFCYIRILQTICRRNKRHRTIRLIFCIAGMFFVGWAPYNIVIFLHTLTEHEVEPFTDCDVSTYLDYALYVCQLLAFSNCCLNPVCYVIVSVQFRNHFKMVLRKIFRSQTGAPVDHHLQ